MSRCLVRFNVGVRGGNSEVVLAEDAIVEMAYPGGAPVEWFAAATGGVGSTDPVRSSSTGDVEVWVPSPPCPMYLALTVSSDASTVRGGTGIPLAFAAFTESVPLSPAWSQAGDVADIPAPGLVEDGFTFYAEDEGLRYVKVGAYGGGAWVVDRPGTWVVEHIVEAATPLGTAFNLALTGTRYAVPGFTTAPFTYEGGVIEAVAANFSFSKGATATDLGINVIAEFTKDAGATWHPMGIGTQRSNTDLTLFGLGWVSSQDHCLGAAPSGAAAPAPGDTVQVRAAAVRTTGAAAAVQLVNYELLSALPFLLVKQG